uniref:Uncharacterized protein n=1 Tax=viral metagenome TaxID=1070528 RepID=A0A6C0HZ44_9ZZZZ
MISRMDNSFKIGSRVIVYERNYPDVKYEGEIYQILNKKLDEYDPNTQLAEYFFISFSVDIYDKLLSQRYPIYYNNIQKIVSNIVRNEKTNKIEQIFVQYPFIDYEEEEIQLNKINAILISTTKWNLSIFQ